MVLICQFNLCNLALHYLSFLPIWLLCYVLGFVERMGWGVPALDPQVQTEERGRDR